MTIKKVDKYYLVPSSSSADKSYQVDLSKETCSCPAFVFRRKECKHIKAVKEFVGSDSGPDEAEQKLRTVVLTYVRKNKQVEVIELIEEFGEEIVDKLLKEGELMESKGVVRVLE